MQSPVAAVRKTLRRSLAAHVVHLSTRPVPGVRQVRTSTPVGIGQIRVVSAARRGSASTAALVVFQQNDATFHGVAGVLVSAVAEQTPQVERVMRMMRMQRVRVRRQSGPWLADLRVGVEMIRRIIRVQRRPVDGSGDAVEFGVDGADGVSIAGQSNVRLFPGPIIVEDLTCRSIGHLTPKFDSPASGNFGSILVSRSWRSVRARRRDRRRVEARPAHRRRAIRIGADCLGQTVQAGHLRGLDAIFALADHVTDGQSRARTCVAFKSSTQPD